MFHLAWHVGEVWRHMIGARDLNLFASVLAAEVCRWDSDVMERANVDLAKRARLFGEVSGEHPREETRLVQAKDVNQVLISADCQLGNVLSKSIQVIRCFLDLFLGLSKGKTRELKRVALVHDARLSDEVESASNLLALPLKLLLDCSLPVFDRSALSEKKLREPLTVFAPL
jgi:hypothetical protein